MSIFRFVAFVAILGGWFGSGSPGAVQAQTIPFILAGSGDVSGGLLPLAPNLPVDHVSSGWATKVGTHSGDGAIQLIAPPDLGSLTAQFQSARPYRFVSQRNSNNVLACNYGDVTAALPAAQPGLATFISISPGADLGNPLDDTFIIAFLAEFRPELSQCSGLFAPNRLKSGRFQMLAISGPVVIDLQRGGVVNATGEGPIPYTWYGVGSLTFKFPFGLF